MEGVQVAGLEGQAAAVAAAAAAAASMAHSGMLGGMPVGAVQMPPGSVMEGSQAVGRFWMWGAFVGVGVGLGGGMCEVRTGGLKKGVRPGEHMRHSWAGHEAAPRSYFSSAPCSWEAPAPAAQAVRTSATSPAA